MIDKGTHLNWWVFFCVLSKDIRNSLMFSIVERNIVCIFVVKETKTKNESI